MEELRTSPNGLDVLYSLSQRVEGLACSALGKLTQNELRSMQFKAFSVPRILSIYPSGTRFANSSRQFKAEVTPHI